MEDDQGTARRRPRRRAVRPAGPVTAAPVPEVQTPPESVVEKDDGAVYVQTARQTVLNLTTINPDTAQEDVDRLLAGASGDFQAEFEGREGPFVEVVQQARVDSVGEIIEAGLESSGDDYGEVLVAARAMVQNSDNAEPEPEPRDFRLRVRVVDDGGVMTASRVEFVP